MTARGSDEAADPRAAQRQDRLLTLVAVLSVAVLFGVASAVQAALIFRLGVSGYPVGEGLGASLAMRTVVNVACVLVLGLGAWLLRFERRRTGSFVLLALAVAVSGALVRLVLQFLLGIYTGERLTAVALDFAAALVVACLAFIVAYILLAVLRGQRAQALASTRQRLRAAGALAALQSEEIRVRRQVAEGLHGTVQQRLVLVTARLAELADRLRAGDAREVADALGEVAADLDTMREVNVRQVSQLLYPAGVEVGLAQAARLMVGRVPPSIATTVRIDESVVGADDPERGSISVAQRLLLLRVIEEAITNALRHGHASAISLELCVDDGVVRLVVDDDGGGLPEPGPRLGGLSFLVERLDAVGGGLTLESGPLGGARLVGTLPLRAAS